MGFTWCQLSYFYLPHYYSCVWLLVALQRHTEVTWSWLTKHVPVVNLRFDADVGQEEDERREGSNVRIPPFACFRILQSNAHTSAPCPPGRKGPMMPCSSSATVTRGVDERLVPRPFRRCWSVRCSSTIQLMSFIFVTFLSNTFYILLFISIIHFSFYIP